MGIGPLASNEFSVPAQQRLGPHDEQRPPAVGEQSGGGHKEDSIRVVQVRSTDLPTQDCQFVMEHDDLEVLRGSLRNLNVSNVSTRRTTM